MEILDNFEQKNARDVHLEIERIFLVARIPEDLKKYPRIGIRQGYLKIGDDESETRIRRRERIGKPTQFFYGEKNGTGLTRAEIEYQIRSDEFAGKWPYTHGRRIYKTRFIIPHGDEEIDLDIFEGLLGGLVIAEMEFKSEELSRNAVLPDWFGPEVTDDPRYKNHNLARQGLPEDYKQPDFSAATRIFPLLFNTYILFPGFEVE